MATKLKKRKPAATFTFFVLAVSMVITSTVAAIMIWNPWGMGLDFKETEQYNKTMASLLYEAARTAMDLPPETGWEAETRAAAVENGYDVSVSENIYTITLGNGETYTVESTGTGVMLAGESTNVSWFLQGLGETKSHGEQAQTSAQFEAAVRAKSMLASQGKSQVMEVAAQGDYAHFLLLDKNGVHEEKNTRFGLITRDTTLARSEYEWIFPTEVRQMLSSPAYQDIVVCLAVRAEQSLNNMGEIYSAYYNWFRYMGIFVAVVVAGGVALLVLLITLLKFRSLSLANHAIAQFFGRFWLEPKLLITAVALYIGLLQAYYASFYDPVNIIAFLPCFWWCWLMLLDVCINKAAFFKHNSVASVIRFYHSLESKYPFLERMKKRAGLLLCAEAALILLVALLTVYSEPSFSNTLAVLLGIALVLVGLLLLVLYIRTYNRELDEFGLIVEYAHGVRAGTAQMPLTVRPESAFAPLADDLSEIHSGINNAVEERVRSEKMKAELVTNVSHDLKTPLTSIINYVGLLDKEELSPAYTNDYVDILTQKTQRLKNLVQDLFEVSKANSGAVEMKPEQLDLAALVEQTIAELDERSSRAGIEIKTQLAEPRIYAVADGRQIHRVFENLLGNAIKYSLAGTRVYITACTVPGGAEIVFKNVAGYEMSFSEDDIVERFQRGDDSRTTEGSGLGLAIAKSFVELNKGSLKIKLDGDLFKATVFLPSSQLPAGQPAAAAPVPEQPHQAKVWAEKLAGAVTGLAGSMRTAETEVKNAAAAVDTQMAEAVSEVEIAVGTMEKELENAAASVEAQVAEAVTKVEEVAVTAEVASTTAETAAKVEPVLAQQAFSLNKVLTEEQIDTGGTVTPGDFTAESAEPAAAEAEKEVAGKL